MSCKVYNTFYAYPNPYSESTIRSIVRYYHSVDADKQIIRRQKYLYYEKSLSQRNAKFNRCFHHFKLSLCHE